MDEIRDIRRRAGLTEAYHDWVSKHMDVERVARITRLDLPPSSWELFSSMTGWERVANTLTNTFVQLVNKGLSRKEVEGGMYKIMGKYSKFGTSDTEPQGTLEDLLDAVFGSKDNF